MTTSSPFFSVIIPLFNKEKHIRKTLETVVNQDFEDFEIIIINDGCTDNSLSEVNKIKDSRIKIYNQDNLGLSAARNNGIKHSRGHYIALIDADDFWCEHHLEKLYNLIKDFPNQGAYCTGYTLKKSEKIFHRAIFNNLPDNFRAIVPNFFKHSMQHCVAWVGSVCIPKVIFEDVGDFDPEIYSEQDTDLYVRIALKHNFVLDDTSVSSIYNRTMDDNMSNFSEKRGIPKFFNAYKVEEDKNQYLKKFMDLNRFSTLVFFKLSGKKTLEKQLKYDINFKNLTLFQRIILRLPNPLVRLLFKIKDRFKLNPFLVFKTN